MRKKLVIFGASDVAQLAHTYFTASADYEVVAFSVNSNYIRGREFCGLPLIPFECVKESHPPEDFCFFVAVGYSKINDVRKKIYFLVKSMGYMMASYISPAATILNSGKIGENCFILEDNTIQPFVEIGNNVFLWSGNHVGHHSIIRDHVFVASHAVISGGVEIGEQCFIGVNATLRDRIKVGDRSIIGAGALILKDVAPEGVYLGAGTERSRVPSTRLRKI